MSQIELGEDASPAPTGHTDSRNDQAARRRAAPPASSNAASYWDPLSNQWHSARSTLIEPRAAAPSSGTANRAIAAASVRRYLVQLGADDHSAHPDRPGTVDDCHRCRPRISCMYFGIGTGIDVSAFFLPIAVGLRARSRWSWDSIPASGWAPSKSFAAWRCRSRSFSRMWTGRRRPC